MQLQFYACLLGSNPTELSGTYFHVSIHNIGLRLCECKQTHVYLTKKLFSKLLTDLFDFYLVLPDSPTQKFAELLEVKY